MSIKFHYRGVPVECDTPADAADLLRLLAGASSNGHATPAPPPTPPTPPAAANTPSITSVIQRLGDHQKQALRVIAESEDGIRDAALRARLNNIDGSALGGRLAAISKEARRQGYDARRFLRMSNLREEGRRFKHYVIPRNAIDEVRDALSE